MIAILSIHGMVGIYAISVGLDICKRCNHEEKKGCKKEESKHLQICEM